MCADRNIVMVEFQHYQLPRSRYASLASPRSNQKLFSSHDCREETYWPVLAEAVAEVTGNEFVGPGMRPGDVRRHIKNADPEEEKLADRRR
jgi:hypothetical protein